MKATKTTTYQLTGMALMAALMCILGPMSIPIGTVPISFTNLVIYFAVYLLGTWQGTVSYLIYMLLGICGLPVFSGYSGGLQKLAGPTGGYLVGFIFMALITGFVLRSVKYTPVLSILGMIVATLVAYFLGTAWFVLQMKCSVGYALGICVFPFLLGDFIKILIAAIICPVIRQQLIHAGLL